MWSRTVGDFQGSLLLLLYLLFILLFIINNKKIIKKHLYDFHGSHSYVHTYKLPYQFSSFRFVQVTHITVRVPADDIATFTTFPTENTIWIGGKGVGPRWRR
jgi:hypothetical protein